jgi:hypothetical protein
MPRISVVSSADKTILLLIAASFEEQPNFGIVPLSGIFKKLDSRFRGNDELSL